MPLPPSIDFTGSSVTEGNFKTNFTAMREWLATNLGELDTHIRLFRGTGATRPSATESGWFRWNTTTDDADISVGTTWKKFIISSIDGTWSYLIDTTVATIQKFKTSNAEGRIEVECATAGNANLGTDADEIFLKSTGTKPVRIWINGVAVFKLDSSGNLIVTGNVTANGSV